MDECVPRVLVGVLENQCQHARGMRSNNIVAMESRVIEVQKAVLYFA
jgi:hypothetical protein